MSDTLKHPIITRFSVGTIASELVPVQPLSAPTGITFHIYIPKEGVVVVEEEKIVKEKLKQQIREELKNL